MRISDWSSDVCSSDLAHGADRIDPRMRAEPPVLDGDHGVAHDQRDLVIAQPFAEARPHRVDDRAVGGEIGRASWGKSVSVRVDLGGRRIIKKKNTIN